MLRGNTSNRDATRCVPTQIMHLSLLLFSKKWLLLNPETKLHAEAALCVKQWREGKDYGMLWTERRGESLHSYIKGVYWRFVLAHRNFATFYQSKQGNGQCPSGMYYIPVFVLSWRRSCTLTSGGRKDGVYILISVGFWTLLVLLGRYCEDLMRRTGNRTGSTFFYINNTKWLTTNR